MTPWIPWSGGECPVAENVRVEVKFRSGQIYTDSLADSWEWNHISGEDPLEVIAYRVLSADGGEGE